MTCSVASVTERGCGSGIGAHGMDEVFLTFGLSLQRQGYTHDEVLRRLSRMASEEAVDAYDAWFKEQTQRVLDIAAPAGWRETESVGGIHRPAWYAGSVPPGQAWAAVRPVLVERIGERATADLDSATDKIVGSLGDPGVRRDTVQGLVIGFVQSGKTSSYTAVAAKAADAGYRLIIVLAGLHNALRQQTQVRLERDLIEPVVENGLVPEWMWQPLTDSEDDFHPPPGGNSASYLGAANHRLLLVIKKNPRRLERFLTWLQTCPESVREACPTLILDDEADQASVNSARIDKIATRINRQLRELITTMPSVSYVGYTATPYANVLIDPSEDDLYPRDFIYSLPRPEGYQGPEVLFGRESVAEDDDPDDGFDMIREVPEEEAAQIVYAGHRDGRAAFVPEVTPSFEEALRWFLIATAVRRARGQVSHSSMLVHTSPFVAEHSAMATRLRTWLHELRAGGGPDASWREQWEREAAADTPPTTGGAVGWEAVAAGLGDVIAEASVVVDNGASNDRLDYRTDEPQVVIVVGGATLSRGLTLEGLVSSFFLRGARTYDALMQMGRWFGYRPGYEDLPRMWMEATTIEAFRFISTVEEEIRRDVERYELESLTPEQFAVRIRTHPNLAVTSPMKMQHAERSQVSYAGRRHQTFIFEHRDRTVVDGNMAAGRTLVEAAVRGSERIDGVRAGAVAFRDVDPEAVASFLTGYRFHADHRELDGERILAWLRKRTEGGLAPMRWNVAVAGRSSAMVSRDGTTVDLGTVEFARGVEVACVNRAQMSATSQPDRADIKTLMSKQDSLIDVPGARMPDNETELAILREEAAAGHGLLILYPVSAASVPMRNPSGRAVRKPLDAVGHLLGVGLVFPRNPPGATFSALDVSYVAVRLPGLEAEDIEELAEAAETMVEED